MEVGMNVVTRLTGGMLIFVVGSAWIASPTGVQDVKVTYLSPAESAQNAKKRQRSGHEGEVD
jgi:hypothetical protein